jgi:hypothetical protein
MNCEVFQRGEFCICRHCQQPLAPGESRACSRGPLPKLNPEPQSPNPALADCLHRGPELRMEDCPPCSGRSQLKIFACAVHGECTLGELPGVHRCDANCGDYCPTISDDALSRES